MTMGTCSIKKIFTNYNNSDGQMAIEKQYSWLVK